MKKVNSPEWAGACMANSKAPTTWAELTQWLASQPKPADVLRQVAMAIREQTGERAGVEVPRLRVWVEVGGHRYDDVVNLKGKWWLNVSEAIVYAVEKVRGIQRHRREHGIEPGEWWKGDE